MAWPSPRAAFALIAGLMPFVVTPLAFPFGRDQGIYGYTAWAWLEGDMPYRDVYVFKPPGTIWVHALALRLFGHSMTAIRVLDLVWTVALAFSVAALARRWSGSGRAGVVAGVAAGFMMAGFDFWNTAQTDGWMALPMVLAVLVAERVRAGETGRAALALAGVLVGIATMFKYTAAIALVPVVVAAWRGEGRRAVVDVTLVGAGVLTTVAATAAWLEAGRAFPGFWDSQAELVPGYVERTGVAHGLTDVPGRLWWAFTASGARRYLGIGVLAGLLAWLLPGHGAARRAPALALLLAGLGSIVAQNKYFVYHMLFVAPAAAVGLGLAVDRIAIVLERRWARSGPVAMAAVALAMVLGSVYPGRWVDLARLAAGERTLDERWQADEYVYNAMSVRDAMAAAAEVRATTVPGDRVFVWGYDPIVNFLAERRTVSRFLYNYPFAVAWGSHRYDAELLDALRNAPPALFVVGSRDATPHVTRNKADSAALFAKFTALSAFVAAEYGPPRTVARYTFYARRPVEAPAAHLAP